MKQGFSLIELSIVIVILGLLVGGILAGRSLIEAAEKRKMAANIKSYETAAIAFKEQYGALPGDLNNATEYWLAEDPDVANGNANGAIASGGATVVGSKRENLQLWKHLALAGLIKGEYAGMIITPWYEAGTNLPEIAPNLVTDINNQPAYWTDMEAGLYYIIGGLGQSGTHYFLSNSSTRSENSLSLEEIYLLDKKFDDADDRSGNIVLVNIGSSCNASFGHCLIGWRSHMQ